MFLNQVAAADSKSLMEEWVIFAPKEPSQEHPLRTLSRQDSTTQPSHYNAVCVPSHVEQAALFYRSPVMPDTAQPVPPYHMVYLSARARGSDDSPASAFFDALLVS